MNSLAQEILSFCKSVLNKFVIKVQKTNVSMSLYKNGVPVQKKIRIILRLEGVTFYWVAFVDSLV